MNKLTPKEVERAVEYAAPGMGEITVRWRRIALAQMLYERCQMSYPEIASYMSLRQHSRAIELCRYWHQLPAWMREWGTFAFDKQLRAIRGEAEPCQGGFVKREAA